MKVAVLQQFLRSLAAPLQAAGASPKVTTDLEQACNALEPFKEEDFGQFAAFLSRAEEFHRTQLLPMLKTKERPRGAARTLNEAQVQHLARQVRQMEERAAAAPGGNRLELAPELDRIGLENLTKPEALALAKEVGLPTKARTTADDAIQMVRRLVLQGREAVGQPSRPAAAAAAPAPDADKIQHLTQEVRHLEERAAGADASPEGLNADLDRLGLDQLNDAEILAVARELGVPLEPRTAPDEAVRLIRRSVLDRKETLEAARV